MEEKLRITKVSRKKGDDGYRTFSIRIPEATLFGLEKAAGATGRSRNQIINKFIEFGLKHLEVVESESGKR